MVIVPLILMMLMIRGGLEGACGLKHGSLVSLSNQQLIDCSWNYGNSACDGGMLWHHDAEE